jgi:hypothetical protein
MLDKILSERILKGESVAIMAIYPENDTGSCNEADRVYAALSALNQKITCVSKASGLRYSISHKRDGNCHLVVHVDALAESHLSSVVSILSMPTLEFAIQKPT